MPQSKRKASRSYKPRPVAGKPIFVVLLLQNRLIRDAVLALLSTKRDLEVILGTSANVLGQLDPNRPTVVVITGVVSDLRTTISEVKRRNPGASVVVLGAPAEHLLELARSGAAGFVADDATAEELLSTIRAVARGNEVFPSSLTELLVRQMIVGGSRVSATIEGTRMTAREREIFVLVAQGLSNKGIAQRLGISTHTVKGHVHNLLVKTTLHTRLELALRGGSLLPRPT